MPFRPNEITKEHVLKAAEKVESDNISLIPSIKYDVFINGKAFPPIDILRYAHEQLDGEKRWDYKPGDQSFRYFEKLGFEVKSKIEGIDPVDELIERYKAQLAEFKLSDELYKWSLLQRFRGKPEIDKTDLFAEFKGIDFSNLVFHNARVVMLNLAKDAPDEYRVALRALFNENSSLVQRIEGFRREIDELYKNLGQTLGTHHDERTISTLLTYQNPEKYTFYKDSYYRKFCELLNLKPKKTGEKYTHYLELIDDLIAEYIENDDDLLKSVNSLLSDDYFNDANHKILAQDILYQMLDKTEVPNYWVFQANPKVYDLDEGLRSGVVDNWTVSAHKDKIKVGDKVILWSTGDRAGCYALAEVTREPQIMGELADDHLWMVEDRNSWSAGIRITHNLVSKPILKDRIKSTPGLHDLKAGLQGTNFTATKKQFEIIADLIDKNRDEAKLTTSQTSMAKNTILYGPPGTGKTYNSIDKAVEIIDGLTPRTHTDNKARFDELRQQGQIEFVTFHQNYSYEDFLVGIRPDIEFESLRFQSQRGIFYQIVRRARENFENSKSKRGRRSFDEVFSELIQPVEEGTEVPVTMASGIAFRITEVSDKSIQFTKKSGGRDHTLSIATLRDVVDGVRDVPGGLGSYYTPLVKLIREKRETTEPAEVEKHFVLIIDEINRANISRVFGELITLLEEDKRLGGENELKVTLPNGEKDFGVPPNLYLIGTMNTADKSIALIDIALRRRFEFVGYYPQYDLLEDDAATLLRMVNGRIFEKKKSSDYLIGHAYFMGNVSVESVLRKKVIPLLNEYFAGKVDIITEIFADTAFNVSYNTHTYQWDISQK